MSDKAKTSLSKYKVPSKNVLEQSAERAVQPPTVRKAPARKRGQPKKKAEVKLSAKVQVMFTEEEAAKLKNQAGMVSLSKWVRAQMIEKGIL